MGKMRQIDILNWDSDFFKMKIGEVKIGEGSFFNSSRFLLEVECEKLDLVYIVKYGEYLSDKLCNELDVTLTDTILKMSRSDVSSPEISRTVQLEKLLSKDDLEGCYEIAGQICEVSRFYKEPLIGKFKAIELYHKWIDNSISGQFCDGILLEKSHERVQGIFVVKTNLVSGFGECSLIGVNKEDKGLGIGTKLWKQAIEYWQSIGVYKYAVNFSLQNRASFNFHLGMGFNKLEEVKHIYHFRKNK